MNSAMKQQRWQRMWGAFHDALELDADAREAFLAEACAGDADLREEVVSLLEAHETESDLPVPTLAADHELLSAGDLLGPYRIVDQLGSGGMGVVYEAEQEEPIRRRVALKLIKPGMDSREVIGRFKAEQQALARMDHPSIAKIFEAGVSEQGRLFFAMELCRGEPITRFADTHRLDIADRVRLLEQTAEAVLHAHQKGVLHRDLKPSNILVHEERGQPRPKIIDFGIAKAFDESSAVAHQTRSGRLIGTPEYMSPEQAEAGSRADTRSDVYSLGVVLYELLVGETPFDFGTTPVGALSDRLREEQPTRPSERARQRADAELAAARTLTSARLEATLIGDLDAIVLKALEPTPDRRYASVGALIEDLNRYSKQLPVEARTPSWTDRLSKLVRRNRLATAAILAVATALILGIVGTSWMALVARQSRAAAEDARDLAEAEAATAQAAHAFLESMLSAPDPTRGRPAEGPARETRVVDVLERAAASIPSTFADRPMQAAALRAILGRTYLNLGMLNEAEPLLEEAADGRRQLLGVEAEATATSIHNLGALRSAQGRHQDAEDLFAQAYEVRLSRLGTDDLDTLMSRSGLHDAMLVQGKHQDPVSTYRSDYETAVGILGADHPHTLGLLNNLAHVLGRAGRPEESEEAYEEAYRRRLDVQDTDHPETLDSLNNWAAALIAVGRSDEAVQHYRVLTESFARTVGPAAPATLRAVNNLGASLFSLKRYAEAEIEFQRALSGYQQTLPSEHPLVLTSEANLARLAFLQGRRREAERRYRTLLAKAEVSLPRQHPNVGIFASAFGECLTALGKFEEAERVLLSAARTLREVFPEQHQRVQKNRERLAMLYERWDKPEQAAKLSDAL